MKMPKRLFVCTVLAVMLAISAAGVLPVAAQDIEPNTKTTSILDIWDVLKAAWSNLFLESETPPSDSSGDTPTPPSDDQCSGAEDCSASGGQTEQMPIGDPNG